jgi:hypothetical protein
LNPCFSAISLAAATCRGPRTACKADSSMCKPHWLNAQLCICSARLAACKQVYSSLQGRISAAANASSCATHETTCSWMCCKMCNASLENGGTRMRGPDGKIKVSAKAHVLPRRMLHNVEG